MPSWTTFPKVKNWVKFGYLIEISIHSQLSRLQKTFFRMNNTNINTKHEFNTSNSSWEDPKKLITWTKLRPASSNTEIVDFKSSSILSEDSYYIFSFTHTMSISSITKVVSWYRRAEIYAVVFQLISISGPILLQSSFINSY